MVDQRTRVFYEVMAEYSALRRATRSAERDIARLRAAEDAYNAASVKNDKARTTASQNRSKKVTEEVGAYRDLLKMAGRYSTQQGKIATTTRLANEAIKAENNALATNATRLLAAAAAARAYAAAQQGISRNTSAAVPAVQQGTPAQQRKKPTFRSKQPDLPSMSAADAAREYEARARAAEAASTRWSRAIAALGTQFRRLSPAMAQANGQATTLNRTFRRFADWRPNLVPPFVALVPIIAAVVAALNPLVSLLGAVGTAAFGLTANIASLSGAFLALPGILSAVVGGIASVIASMGGVGNVFKAYSAMQKATGTGAGRGGGSVGETQAERADRLARAELNLAKAQRSVQKAQQNLNKAREQALKDLIDLRVEVSRASMNEERAIANLLEARDNYNNVMADPGSQAGDKADAAVRIKEAEADLEDVRKRNIEAAKELAEAEAVGVEGSERVVDAKEDLQDAILNERDAQRDLQKEINGTSAAQSAAVTAINEYEDALAKLSPSARAVVLALIGMRDQWNAMRQDLQENFFSRFVNDMDKVPQIIRNIGNFLRPAARAMGDFVSNVINLLSSPEWSRDLATIGEQNGRVLDDLGDSLISLAGFFKDLILAAGPFTDWMTNGLAEGAENMRKLLDTEDERNGLAAWLELVAGRLSKWWQIIKNVGKTLFNYGSAASGFGDWLSDGFLRTTENWRAASERAKEDGSPFKQFLEDIKPLLSEVNGLFGDFFGWLSREIMNKDNIKDAQDLVSLLRTDLGPALSGLFDALSETDIDESFIKALSSIIDSVTAIVEAGGGAGFEAFFDVIVTFFDALADLLSGMDKGSVDSLLSIMGGLAAFAFIGKFTGLTNAIGWLLKLDKAKFKSLLGKGGLFAGLALFVGGQEMKDSAPEGEAGAAQRVGGDLVSGAVGGAVTGAAVGSVVPGVGTAVGGLAGLGIGAIGSAFSMNEEDVTAFNEMVNTELGNFWADLMFGFEDAGRQIGDWWSEMWGGLAIGVENFNTTVNTELGNFWTDVGTNWTNFSLWLGEQWNSFWSGLFTWIDTTFVQPVKTAWGAVQFALQAGWTWIQENVITPMSMGFQAAYNWFNNTFIRPIQTAWAALQFTFQTVWNWINMNILQPFGSAMSTVGTWVTNAVNGIRATWERMRSIFADPIRFVVDTVYNRGIRGFWNPINDALKLNMNLAPAPGFKEGGVLPGYSPGVDNHHFIDQNGNRLDLGGGEGILVPQATRQLGGKRGIDQINRDAKAGRQAFKTGGVFGSPVKSNERVARGKGGPWEDITKFAGDVFSKFAGFFSNPGKFIGEAATNLIRPLLDQVPGAGNFSNIIKAMPPRVISGLTDFSKVKAKQGSDQQAAAEKDMAGGGPAPANVMGWQAQWAAVKAAFPGASLNSAYRPGAITATGSKSYHGQGRAIDVTASMAIFNWLKQNYPNSRELIYSPANGRQLQNGREFLWGEPVRSMHYDHVHWAMKHGGVFPGPRGRGQGTHDKGGKLRHGEAALNLSGKPEQVLTNEESRGLKALISGVGLSANGVGTPGMLNSVGSLRGAAQQVIDNSTNIENVNIINPVPEKPSESLPTAIRQIGYMKNARENA